MSFITNKSPGDRVINVKTGKDTVGRLLIGQGKTVECEPLGGKSLEAMVASGELVTGKPKADEPEPKADDEKNAGK
jgi:hypothetical protein